MKEQLYTYELAMNKTTRCRLPGVSIITLGGELERFEADWACSTQIQHRLIENDDIFVSQEHIFDTSKIVPKDVFRKHFETCTGHNWHIQDYVWNSSEAVTLAKEAFLAYSKFSRNNKSIFCFHYRPLLQQWMPPVSGNGYAARDHVQDVLGFCRSRQCFRGNCEPLRKALGHIGFVL